MSVYLIKSPTYPFDKHDWSQELDNIYKNNPEIIIIECLFELEAFDVQYGGLIHVLNPWLEQNNKVIHALLPGIRPNPFKNVIMYPTINAFIITMFKCFINYSDYLDEIAYHRCSYDNMNQYFENPSFRLYTCYMNNPKYERALLLDELVRNDLLNQGIVTFPKADECRDPTTLKKLQFKYHDGTSLFDEEGFVLNSKEEFYAHNLPRSFFRGFLDIITESEFKDNWYFLTEKTLKSLGSLKPFLTFASRGHNKEFLVKKFGFKLYDEYFDYSWDNLGLHDRIDGIVQNLKRLHDDVNIKKTFTLQELYNELLPKILYNRYRVLEIRYDKSFLPEILNNVDTSNIDFFKNSAYGFFVHKTCKPKTGFNRWKQERNIL